MAVKKRDFQKVANVIQGFLGKLACEEATAELRDTLNLALLNLQKYYKILKSRSSCNGNGFLLNSLPRSLGGSLTSNGGISPVSPSCWSPDHFEWKWFNLDSPKLTASIGGEELSLLPPILQAAKEGEYEALGEMIENDERVINEVDALGRDAMMYAVHGSTEGHARCLELLLDCGCDVNHQANDGSTALHLAAHDSNNQALELLLRTKIDCNVEDTEGRTALHWAAANTSLDNVKLLLQHGAELGVVDGEGLTPAMWACHFDQSKNLMLLQTALARIDPRDEALFDDTDIHGRTVIHWAVNRSDAVECLKVLLTGETSMLRDNDGKTVLHLAAEQGNLPACELVLNVQGLDGLRSTDEQQRSALHLAVLCGQGETINYLLEKGAELNASDASGSTALEYMTSRQLHYCLKVFTSHPRYQEELGENEQKEAVERGRENDDRAQLRSTPSAPPAEEVLSEQASGTNADEVISSEHKMDVMDVEGFEVQDGFELAGSAESDRERRHSDPPSGKAERPAISKRTRSAPPVSAPKPPTDSWLENAAENEHGKPNPKRQNTLTRQKGVRSPDKETGANYTPRRAASSIELRSEDDGMLVVMANPSDGEPEDLDGSDLEIECCDEPYERPECRPLVERHRGSTSSASQSDADQDADNGSVSVALSVSSLGNDEDILVEEPDDPHDDEEPVVIAAPRDKPHPAQQNSDLEPRDIDREEKIPPKQTRQMQSYAQTELQEKRATHPNIVAPGQGNVGTTKKKKDKTKKKKLPTPLPPPRGFIAPLGPPGHFGPAAKLGVPPLKPGPWQHAGFGPLRGAPPRPHPADQSGSSEFVNYSLEGDSIDIDHELDDAACIRPGTPEPPRSPREAQGQTFYQPAPPGVGGNIHGVPPRGPKDGGLGDREAFYGLQGSGHGPLAHTTGHVLLKNTDMMSRGKTKMDARQGPAKGYGLHPGYHPQQTLTPRGFGPHPPSGF